MTETKLTKVDICYPIFSLLESLGHRDLGVELLRREFSEEAVDEFLSCDSEPGPGAYRVEDERDE